jgi:hypothetical protein
MDSQDTADEVHFVMIISIIGVIPHMIIGKEIME